MQRKPTKNTRGPNAQEKAFQGWLKEQGCAYCPTPGPSIVDHARGSTFKHQKVLVGHAFCTSKCEKCDSYKTNGNHRAHFEGTGITESGAWILQTMEWNEQNGQLFPDDVDFAMQDFAEREARMYETAD